MAGKILVSGFWALGAALLAHAMLQGGWSLLVPAAVAVALALIALDLLVHRELVAPDWALLRAVLHVLSAVAFAASSMYWLGILILGRG